MTNPNRPPVITGNWKMYKTIEEAVKFVTDLIPLVQDSIAKVYLAVPFTAIKPTSDKAVGGKVVIGAQNMNDATEGAFTGEIAGRMLKEAGASFVLLGHSERRHIFHESNAFINKKVKRALKDGLEPVLCIGETQREREEGKSHEIVEMQLKECLEGIDAEQLRKCIIAYEPVWAIGTGNTATPEIAQEIHQFCRQYLGKIYGDSIAEQLIIQYGGSVKPENAKEIMEQPDIDGLLVGGASLSLDFFSKIVNYNKQE